MSTLPDFQAFTIQHSRITSRVITEISVSPAFDAANPPNPIPAHLDTKALWDTGATNSMISAGLAKALALPSVGKANLVHAGGAGVSERYVVNFGLPNKVAIQGVLVTEFPETHKDFGAIIGMDVISLGDLSITNVSGKTVLSFRTPSCEVIDYVVQAKKLRFAGVGRNAPCPCGSGKKFKKCHGA